MPCKVTFTDHFTDLYDGLSVREQELVDDFVFYAEATGLAVLPHYFPGKIAPTDRVSRSAPDRAAKIAYARANNLWHAHIGYLQWTPSGNPAATYMTSLYVVHFQKLVGGSIALVDYGSHRPMKQPLPSQLFKP